MGIKYIVKTNKIVLLWLQKKDDAKLSYLCICFCTVTNCTAAWSAEIVWRVCVSECLHTPLCVCMYGCLYVGSWVIGSCSLYFHEACSIKRTIPPHAPFCPPVQSTLVAVCCTTPSWLYIIPTFLSLGFLFVFPDALPCLSHWDYKETILRAEQRWTHDLASLKEVEGGWVSLNRYSGSSIWSQEAEWSEYCCTYGCYALRVKWMHALYISTVQSAYNSCIVQSLTSLTEHQHTTVGGWKWPVLLVLPDCVM